MKRPIFIYTASLVMVILAFTGASVTASAHRMHIDVISHTFEIEAYYGDGKPARNATVTVYDPQGEVYCKGKTDDEGKYRIEINQGAMENYTVEVEQSGHRAEITIGTDGAARVKEMDVHLRIIAGLGYIIGIAGIASLVTAWRMKRKIRTEGRE